MNANTYTLDEIQKAVTDTGYKYLSLCKANGQQVIAYNSGGVKAADRWPEIRRRLASKQLPDGLYIVLAKNTQGKANLPDEFYFQKGKVQQLEEAPKIGSILKPAANNPEVTTFSEVLKMKNRITELEFENAALKAQIDDLEEQVEELEEQAEQAPETLKEQPDFLSRAGEWLQSTLIAVQPIIDKHYELKEKQIQNETARLMIASKQAPNFAPPQPQTQSKPHQTDAVEYTAESIKKFIEAQAEAGDVDKYEALATIYNNAADFNDFYNKVKQYDAETFDDLVKFINNKN